MGRLERHAGARALTWRASVAYRDWFWRVTTVKAVMATRFLTAEDAMAATDEAFDRSPDLPTKIDTGGVRPVCS